MLALWNMILIGSKKRAQYVSFELKIVEISRLQSSQSMKITLLTRLILLRPMILSSHRLFLTVLPTVVQHMQLGKATVLPPRRVAACVQTLVC